MKKLLLILASLATCHPVHAALLTNFTGSYAEYRQATAKLADFDNTGRIAGEDFLFWQRGYGRTLQPDNTTGDADGNGSVNNLDLTLWASQIGAAVPLLTNSAAFKLFFDPTGIVAGQVRVVVDLPFLGQPRFRQSLENGIVNPHPAYDVFQVGAPVITAAAGRERFEVPIGFTARTPNNPPVGPITIFGYQVIDERPEQGFQTTQQGFEFDPGDSITVFNSDNGQTTVFDHTQLTDTFVPLDIPLLLHIDIGTGAVSIRNPSFAPINMTYYEVISTAGGLTASGWTSLDDGEGGDPPGVGWEEAGGASNAGVAESNLTGSLAINPGQIIDLGPLYNPSLGIRNLTFSYGTLGGQFKPGAINYFFPFGPSVPVPEPSAAALALVALAGCILVRRPRARPGGRGSRRAAA